MDLNLGSLRPHKLTTNTPHLFITLKTSLKRNITQTSTIYLLGPWNCYIPIVIIQGPIEQTIGVE
jgi:hypothetical protein